MGFYVIHYSVNEYWSLLGCDAYSFIGVFYYFRGTNCLHLNTKPNTVPTHFTSLVPPHLVLMEVCEQKFAVIQYCCIPLPSVYYHKSKWTNWHYYKWKLLFQIGEKEGRESQELETQLSSLVWICTSTHAASKVTVIDANNPADVLESFNVCSSHLLCIASVPG